jgi:hypothetical protein
MNPQLTEQQFLEHFQIADFALKTQAQIAKDFDRLGHSVNPSLLEATLALNELNDIVEEMLINVVGLGESQTLQLLYIIDIPQHQFLSITTDPDFLSKGAALIIRREAQKIYLRSLF